MTADNIRQYQAERRRHLEARDKQLEMEASKIQRERAEIKAQILRLETELPPNACPLCYYEAGIISRLRAVPANPAAPGEDVFRCEKAGHEF